MRGLQDDPTALAAALLRIAETAANPRPLIAAARALLEGDAPQRKAEVAG